MDTGLLDLCLYAPSSLLIQDKKTGETRLCIPVMANKTNFQNTDDFIGEKKRFFFDKIKEPFKRKSFCTDNSGFSGEVYSLSIDLFERNPASFFSYIYADDHKIVSTSPERFIKQIDRHVETRPIKATFPEGSITGCPKIRSMEV